MPRNVSENHFWTGVWANQGPLRLRHYTCIECGTRYHTWEQFRAHRKAGCSGKLSITGREKLPNEAQQALLDHLRLISVEEEIEAVKEVSDIEREVSLDELRSRELDSDPDTIL